MGLDGGLATNGQLSAGTGGSGNMTDRGAWAATTVYSQHDVVIYNGTGWICTTTHTSGATFDETKFTEITNWRGAWQATTRYVAGDTVINGSAIYSAIATFTSGASFAIANWNLVAGSPTNFFLPSANTGAKLETVPRYVLTGNGAALTSQKLYCVALPVPLKAGVTYTGIAFFSGGTAAGTPLNQWFTLVNATNLQTLRSTVDDTTTAWAANSLKRLALSSTLTPAADTAVYLGIMVNATTVPTLISAAGLNGAQISALAPAYAGGSTVTLTTPLADGTTVTAITGTNIIAYGYVD